MEQSNKTQYLIGRIVFVAYIVTVFVIIGAIEYVSGSGVLDGKLGPMFDAQTLSVIHYIFLGISAALIVLAFGLKRAISTMVPGMFLSLAKWIAKNAHRQWGTAYGLLLTIGAMCEAIAILGVLLFFFSGGEKVNAYQLIAPALLMLGILFTRGNDGENLEKIDNEVQ